MTKNFFLMLRCAAAVLVACNASVFAAEEVLIESNSSGLAINGFDVLADAERIPPEVRGSLLSKPDNVKRLSANLLVYRSFASRAVEQGMDRDPHVAAALRVARDKVLSDAWLARMDEINRPDADKLLALARLEYKANPRRFEAPESVRASHILLTGDTPEALAEAESLLALIKADPDQFEALASEMSRDPGSAAKNGSLGKFGRGKMLPAFEEAVFGLENPGDLAGPIKTRFGYHIIRLDERFAAGVKPFEEVREPLIAEMTNKMLQDARAAEANKLLRASRANDEAIRRFAAQSR